MITVIVILVAALAIAGLLTYAFHKNDNDFPVTPPTYTKEELDNIKLAEELYNKDLRPVVAKKAKPVVAKELEVIEPELVTKESKPEFPIDKPAKKKRKYYPKKN
jgi:hypothetical protein